MAEGRSRSTTANQNWQQLAETFLPGARVIAYGFMRAYDSYNYLHDDIYSAAIKGLVDAARRYDEKEGVKFWTYAEPRITGAIRDCIRKSRPGGRPSRIKAAQIENATYDIAAKQGRFPTEEQIAQKLGYTMSQLAKAKARAERNTVIYLDESPINDKNGLHSVIADQYPTPEQELLDKADKDQLHQIIKLLPEKCQMVLWLHYWEDWPLWKIGKLWGVTESRVSQLHIKAITILSQLMQKESK